MGRRAWTGRAGGRVWFLASAVVTGAPAVQVAQRAAQLQEALLHCGRFQDALESLLSWMGDTEELVANQKAPSAEFKVVKAQIFRGVRVRAHRLQRVGWEPLGLCTPPPAAGPWRLLGACVGMRTRGLCRGH